ncbi:MAG TPA: hypothetical protein VK172_00575 [Lentimicrobium sp.]|jgi:hypothetical protein|nr:hypothetical protein [Lentimicrobium sp.]
MKKLSILLFAALFVLAACEKDQDLSNDINLKKKPTNNNTGGTGGANQNNFVVVSPAGDPLNIHVGDIVQLTTAPDPTLYINWYVIDQQIAYIFWDGRVQGVAPGTTVVSAFHYQQQGQPLQDNLIVNVIP